jgi:hypothetical protein
MDGTLYVLDLEKGQRQWAYDIGQPITSSPAVVDGMIVVGADDGRVYAFGHESAVPRPRRGRRAPAAQTPPSTPRSDATPSDPAN